MNKKNLAAAASVLAVSALCVQGAQAQSSVQVYGRLNVDVEHISFSKPTGATSGDVTRLSSNSSRLGFRGVEALGDGLKAIYQIEASVGVDSGSGTLAGRDTFVGLEGGWGRLRLGFFDDVFKGMGEYTDRYKGTGIGNDATIATLGGGGGGFTRTQVNSLRYDSPTVNGFKGELQYGLEDEQRGGKTALTAAASYSRGKLKLGAGLGRHDNFLPGRHDMAYRLGAKYDFGVVDVAGGVTRLSYQLASGDVTRDYWTVSLGYKVGAGVLSAKYGAAGDGRGSAPDGATTQVGSDGARVVKGPRSGATTYVLGYEHNLSKRTQLYAYATRIANEARANYRFGTNGLNSAAAGPGASPTGWVMGMSHDF
ncbi:putative porin [Janthinobacterium sp. CG_23.3]|uniref:porin n=1 Tax=Janthinobacterium sp. CG_23.3 TaxID=3349634 RepID=UPI0038D3F176